MSLAALLLALLACRHPPEPVSARVGEADFSRYVAIGNSLTAGVMNGGLYRSGQVGSYPNLLAQQFNRAGGGDFAQPLFAEGQENGSGYLQLSSSTTLALAPVTDNLAIRSSSPLLYTKFSGPNQNLGIPGIRLSDIALRGYGSAQGNAFFERLLPAGAEQKTYLEAIADSKPTFFTCWLGTNDVQNFVTSGGVKPITQDSTFKLACQQLLKTLAATGARGVVANLPDPTLLPLLMLPANFMAFRRDIARYWITTGKGEVRMATENDLILTTADSIGFLSRAGFPKGFFRNHPLNNDDLLDADEIERAKAAVAAFNAILVAETKVYGWPVMDAKALFFRLKLGTAEDRITLDTDLFKGGQISTTSVFSLDGIHPNPRGYALIANEYIKVINETYKSRVPRLDVSEYSGIKRK
ncbi:MAG: SGNH/GDSL hydrolase family protein [Cytophagaceae bacterium]|nr:SGNH/GDSL hydrolase family protein [Cytophagaceae bacterium]